MYLPLSQADQAFNQIRQDAANMKCSSSSFEQSGSNSCSIIVFVQYPSVDSIASMKILQGLFASEYLSFKIVPLSSPSDLAKANETYIVKKGDSTQSKFKSIILINCGSFVDLQQILSIDSARVYVFDSARPKLLENIFLTDQICLIDNGEIEENYEYLLDLNGVSSDNESNDSDNNTSDKENTQDFDDNENEENYFGETDKEKDSTIKIREEQRYRNQVSIERKKRKKEQKTEYYQQGTFFGSPTSMTMYKLSLLLDKANQSYLWLGLLGLAEQFLLGYISLETYEDSLFYFEDELVKYPKENSAIQMLFEDEFYDLTCLHHWNFYDALINSNTVSARLGAWREKGVLKISTLLARMGISLKEARLPFEYMSTQTKNTLVTSLLKLCAAPESEDTNDASSSRVKYNELSHAGIQKTSLLARGASRIFIKTSLGDQGDDRFSLASQHPRTSAFDSVWSLLALLENESHLKKYSNENENFYSAFDAADFNNSSLLRKGLFLASELQKNIVKIAGNLLSRKLIKQIGTCFRFVILKNELNSTNFIPIKNPLSLKRLADYLIEALLMIKKSLLPLVVAVELTTSQEENTNEELFQGKTVLIVGSFGKARNIQEEKVGQEKEQQNEANAFSDNYFGNAFKLASEMTKIEISQQSFDGSCISMQPVGGDLMRFVQTLAIVLEEEKREQH